MSDAPNFRANATKYVEDQLAIMRKYGSAPILSPAEYHSLVDECERVGRKLWEKYHPSVKGN